MTKLWTGLRKILIFCGIKAQEIWEYDAPLVFLVISGIILICAAKYDPSFKVEVVEQVEQYEDPVFEDVRIVTEWINDEPVDITTTDFNYMVDKNIIDHFCCTDIQVQHIGGSELSRCYDIYAPNKERAREAAEYIFSTWENIGVQKTIHVLVLSEEDPELVKYSFTKDYF